MERMRWHRVPPSTAIFNMQIKAFGRAGRADAAEAVLREMAGSGSWDMEALGITPNAISYAAAADAWACLGQAARARALLNRSANAGVELDQVSYGTLVKAHARAREPAAAEAVLTEAAARARPLGVVAWTQAVAAWAAAGEAEEVRRMLRSMEARAGGAPAPNAVTFHAALGALAAAGRVAGAVSVLCDMVRWAAAKGDWAARAPAARAAWDRGFTEAGLGGERAARLWAEAVAAAAEEEGGRRGAAAAPRAAEAQRRREVLGATRAAENARARAAAAAARRRAQAAPEETETAGSSSDLTPLRSIMRRMAAPPPLRPQARLAPRCALAL